MKLFPKNKTGGIVTSTVMGVGGLIIGIIVMLVVIQTLNDADLLTDAPTNSLSIVNESFGGVAQGIWLNSTTFTLASANSSTDQFTITDVYNITTGTGTILPSANYTVDSATGIIQNATDLEYPNVTVSYSFVFTGTVPDEKASTNRLTTNFTTGIDNIGDKIPTILLIVAVVFLFGALVLLVRNARTMTSQSAGGSL